MNNNQKLRKKRQEEAKKIANKRIGNKKNLFKKLSVLNILVNIGLTSQKPYFMTGCICML